MLDYRFQVCFNTPHAVTNVSEGIFVSINDAMGFWVISRRVTQESLLKGSPRRSAYRLAPSPKTMTYAGLQSNPAIEFKETAMFDWITAAWIVLSAPISLLAGMFIAHQDCEDGE